MSLETELKKETQIEYRKIHGIHQNESFTLTLPKNLITQLGITGGDYIKYKVEDQKLVIRKAEN